MLSKEDFISNKNKDKLNKFIYDYANYKKSYNN